MADIQTPSTPEAPPKASDTPAANTATAGEQLRLTDKAVQMVKITREQEGLDPNSGLRVAVRGGGCSGFEYALDFELESRDTDHILEYEGLEVFLDPVSSRYLTGTVIDYVLGPAGSGFKFNNPKASGTCGCGSSFSM